jgi:hypothetical protein
VSASWQDSEAGAAPTSELGTIWVFHTASAGIYPCHAQHTGGAGCSKNHNTLVEIDSTDEDEVIKVEVTGSWFGLDGKTPIELEFRKHWD